MRSIKGVYDFYESYYYKLKENLDEAYKSYSIEKQHAWHYCMQQLQRLNGHRGKIISHNTFVFTYGFCATLSDGDYYFILIRPSCDLKLNLRTGETSYL